MSEVTKQRGPYPGLGAVLCAFGVTQGVIVAEECVRGLGDREDPWDRVARAFASPTTLPPSLRSQISPSLQTKFSQLEKPAQAERRAFLRLLSRFALSSEQASTLWHVDDRTKARIYTKDIEYLSDPYNIYNDLRKPVAILDIVPDESDQDTDDADETTSDNIVARIIPPVSLRMIDRGIFLEKPFSDYHSLSGISAMVGPRR